MGCGSGENVGDGVRLVGAPAEEESVDRVAERSAQARSGAAAVGDGQITAVLVEVVGKGNADSAADVGDVVGGRGLGSADRPVRLVGHDDPGAGLDGAGEADRTC